MTAFLGAGVQCEMCGKDVPRTRKILVDRSVLQVGPECERFGKALEPGPGARVPVAPGNVPMALEKRKRAEPRDVYATESMQLELVEDFAVRIKNAREKRGLTRQELGAKVGEREIVMGRIENGSLHPTDDVAKKLERELAIKLFEPVATGATAAKPSRAMTLGDMLRDAQKKKSE